MKILQFLGLKSGQRSKAGYNVAIYSDIYLFFYSNKFPKVQFAAHFALVFFKQNRVKLTKQQKQLSEDLDVSKLSHGVEAVSWVIFQKKTAALSQTDSALSQFDFDNRQGWVEIVNSASGGNYTFSIAGPRRWVFEAVVSNLKPPLEFT